MFSDEEIMSCVNQARSSAYQGAAAPGAVGAPAGFTSFTIPDEVKDKLKAVLIGFLRLLFTEFMSVSAVQQQGLQRGPAAGGAMPGAPAAAPDHAVVPAAEITGAGPIEAVTVPTAPPKPFTSAGPRPADTAPDAPNP